MGPADDEEGPMVFATKEMQQETKERAKRKFDANPRKHIRLYKGLMGGIIVFLVALIFLTV